MFSDEEEEDIFLRNSIETHWEFGSKSNINFSASPSVASSSSSFVQLLPSPASTSSAATLCLSPNSFQSNGAGDILLSSSQSSNVFKASIEVTEQKDSGYDTLPLEKSQFLKEFVPYIEPRSVSASLEEPESCQTDLIDEAFQFIKNPTESAILNPNLEYYEAKLIEANVLPDLKKFVRQSLQNELEKIKNMKPATEPTEIAAAIGTDSPDLFSHDSPSPSQVLTGGLSPDLFASEDEDFDTKGQSPSIFQYVSSESKALVPSVNCENNVLVQFTFDDVCEKPSTDKRRKCLIKKIENLIKEFLGKIVNDETLQFTIRSATVSSNFYLETNEVLTLKTSQDCVMRRVSLGDERSRFRFALIMFLLAEIYYFLLTETRCTARELYYKDPEFVEDQANIGLAIKDICSLLDAAPWELGVFSSSKGLIAGSLVISLANGEDVDCSVQSGGILLPHETSGVKSLRSTAKYALIVEKDTVYEKLLQQDIFDRLGRDVILITGKGFPDINTRIIVKKIATELGIPMYGLFDADPFGIDIFFVYRHGSRAMSFNADNLACPSVKWIGIHPSEIELLGIPSMPLSADDKRRLESLLDRPYISDEVRRELLVLRRGNRKAEIEGVSSFSENYLLTEYIPNKIIRDFTI